MKLRTVAGRLQPQIVVYSFKSLEPGGPPFCRDARWRRVRRGAPSL